METDEQKFIEVMKGIGVWKDIVLSSASGNRSNKWYRVDSYVYKDGEMAPFVFIDGKLV